MSSLVHFAYALCAATIVAYLAGWPISVAFGTAARRFRLYLLGAIAAALVLVLAGTPWFVSVAAGLVGAGLAVGFAEVAFSGPRSQTLHGKVQISSAKTAAAPDQGIPELEWVVEEGNVGVVTEEELFEEAQTLSPPAQRSSQLNPKSILGPLVGRTIHGAPAPKSMLGPLATQRGQGERACPRCGTNNLSSDLRCRECHVAL